MSKNKITTAVIAAGGYGTRFLPFTKVVPKELLPIVDTPTIELLVKECIDAGIEKIFIIVRSDSTIIQKHFASNIAYEKYLHDASKEQYIDKINIDQYKSTEIIFVQEDDNIPYGNARGLFSIKKELESEQSFLLLFGDDIVFGSTSSVGGLIQKYMDNDCEAMVGAQKMPFAEIPKYGNIKIKAGTEDQIETLIQKPKPENIVSDLVIYSQLILTPEIFKYLNIKVKNVELDVGVALNNLAQNKKVLAYNAGGTWVTIGDPVNYLKANIAQMVYSGLLDKDSIINYIKTLKDL